MSLTTTTGNHDTLKRLARTIRETWETTESLVENARKKGQEAIAEAILCGDALNAAKELVEHKEWLPWLKEHCPTVKERTAQNYMKLAKTQHVADLDECQSLRQAYITAGIIPEKEFKVQGSKLPVVGDAPRVAVPPMVTLPMTPDEEEEALIQKCITTIREEQRASVSLLQRRHRLGYTHSSQIMDELERRGLVGPAKGAEPRDVLIELEQETPPTTGDQHQETQSSVSPSPGGESRGEVEQSSDSFHGEIEKLITTPELQPPPDEPRARVKFAEKQMMLTLQPRLESLAAIIDLIPKNLRLSFCHQFRETLPEWFFHNID